MRLKILPLLHLLTVIMLLHGTEMLGQTVNGRVINELNEPLVGASVFWLGTDVGTATNQQGYYEIARAGESNSILIASFVGHSSDTLKVTQETVINFQLKTASLTQVIVLEEQYGVVISDNSAIKTEKITQTELVKAACCDLAGCFETQTTVQPQTTNVITNSKELRILGLSGVYNQVLLDGFPMIQGLTYTYGISSVPGSIVDNIYVSKGANSVLQGFESISGQINVETKEPDKTDKLYANVYANNFLEKHINANYAFRRGDWSNVTSVHTVQPADKIDRDEDNFLDLPLLTRYMIANKWKYGNELASGWHCRLGLRYTDEQRIGGQTSFDPSSDKGSTTNYGQNVNIQQPEAWIKSGYRFNEKHHLVLLASSFHQQQQSYFGSVRYDAQQTNAYTNLQYELNYSGNELKTGITYRHLDLTEHIDFTDTLLERSYNGHYHRMESIPGIFAENTIHLFNEKLTWIAGIRGDDHNQFGFRITPRTLVKYDITPRTIVRANVGTGWRTVNLFSENIGLLVSSRDIVFEEMLKPEQAFNTGVNLTQKFESADENLSGYFSADLYHTQFSNQIFPDYDSSPTLAIVRNFTGTAVSNGFQAEFNLKLFKRFDWKTGYNFLDVYRMINGEKQLLPFNPRHKLLGSWSYKPLSDQFHVDVNVHWYGEQRLPNTQSNPESFRRPDCSKPYTLVNAQFTYSWTRFEVYLGCENIFDFRQLRPIIGWQDPFSPYFDTSSVWGPTRGREVYGGVRYRVNSE